MQVPLLDLKLQYAPLREAIRAEVEALMDSQSFILGPKVEAFEAAICDYTGAAHAVGVTSGTDALLMTLMALGIGPGDAVLTTPYTFFGTAGSIARTGAEPVFLDIEASHYNLSPARLCEFLESCPRDAQGRPLSRAGNVVRALMPVHLYGLAAPMEELLALAAEHGLPVIEDAAQALGAQYPAASGPAYAGTMGDFGTYSFFPSKNLGAFGDGGLIVCRDAEMAATLRALRNHGGERRYYHRLIGGNFRLDALQAAILSLKLPYLDAWSAGRQRNAAFYRQAFAEAGLGGTLTLPEAPYAASGLPGHHIYNQFVIRAPRRDALCEALAGEGIGHAIYYPLPLHLQECFAPLGYKEGDLPEAERAALETLALPIYPELNEAQMRRVVEVIARFYEG